MRNLMTISTALIVALSLFACTQKKKEMTVQDFAKIDMEVVKTDTTPESKKKIAEKYGYTLEQYEAFAEKAEKDPTILEKLGEISLEKQKKIQDQEKK